MESINLLKIFQKNVKIDKKKLKKNSKKKYSKNKEYLFSEILFNLKKNEKF